jgi:hypothetical protein
MPNRPGAGSGDAMASRSMKASVAATRDGKLRLTRAEITDGQLRQVFGSATAAPTSSASSSPRTRG